jgi:hypothetical protein
VGETVSFRLESANLEKLREIARACGITPNRMINKLIAVAELTEIVSVRPVAVIWVGEHDQRAAPVATSG